MSLEVIEVASPRGRDGVQAERWPDAAWRRLMAAVADPGRVWASVPHCGSCGRPLAAADCEPDPVLCWSRVTGACA